MIVHIPPLAANIAGFCGIACMLGAYAYITAVPAPSPVIQHGVNLVGAVLLILSLLVDTNLAALTQEVFWAAIAIWGLIRTAGGGHK